MAERTELAEECASTHPHVRLIAHDPAVAVHVTAAVDMANVGGLRTGLLAALTTVVPPAPIVVDLTGVTFLGSVGLNELVMMHERAAVQDTPLRLVATQRSVLRAFAVTGLDSVLSVYENLDRALHG